MKTGQTNLSKEDSKLKNWECSAPETAADCLPVPVFQQAGGILMQALSYKGKQKPVNGSKSGGSCLNKSRDQTRLTCCLQI